MTTILAGATPVSIQDRSDPVAPPSKVVAAIPVEKFDRVA